MAIFTFTNIGQLGEEKGKLEIMDNKGMFMLNDANY